MSFFFCIALLVFFFLTYYPFCRLLGLLRLLPASSFIIPSLFIIITIFFCITLLHIIFRHDPLPHFLTSLPINDLNDKIASISYFFFGFMVTFCLVTLFRDIFFLLSHIITFCLNHLVSQTSLPAPLDTERRKFLFSCTSGLVLFSTGASVLAGYKTVRLFPRVIRQKISLNTLHPDLRGLTILQLSDIHLGGGPDNNFIAKISQTCREIQADIIVITGDLVDGPVHELHHYLQPLAQLQPPLGKFFVTGNHDYYSGIDAWLPVIEDLGFTILINEHRIIQRGAGSLYLAGVTDIQGSRFSPEHRCDPELATNGIDSNHTKILLAHRPTTVTAAAKLGYDLQLSGHTHGGQFFPANLLVACAQPYMKGLYQVEKTKLYVSRGTGYWGPPLRLGVPAEITVCTLV